MVNPNRIRQARELIRLTQAQLAEAVGVTQSTIAHIEAGRSEPSEPNLEAIASHLGFPMAFFHRDDPPNFPSGSLLFRAHAKMNAADRDQAYRYGELEFEATLNLINRVRVKSVLKLPKLADEEFNQSDNPIQYAAQLTRDALGLAQQVPIPNLTKLIEQSGVIVLALPVSFDSCDAFSQWVSMVDATKGTARARKAFIVVAGNVPGDRLRFSLAHEIGHLVLHQSITGRSKAVEDEATEFASEFMLPEAAIRQQITKPVTLTNLAKLKLKWGVSIQALIVRARDLNIITPRQTTYLFSQINGEKWRKNEPVFIALEKPRALRRLTEVIYGNPINYQKLGLDLGLHPHFVKRLLDVYATQEEFNQLIIASNVEYVAEDNDEPEEQSTLPSNISQFNFRDKRDARHAIQ